MKIKNIFKVLVVSGMLAPAMTSCSDWLQVDLEDSILESALFETNEGYTSALNGVYTQMNEQYASKLTMGTLDVMAKLYNVGMEHNSYPYYTFAFDDSQFKSMSNSLWTSHYFQIANLNNLLEFCDMKESALKDHYRPYVQGEALALRAMLHFDLLRIYGPIYSEETASTICMPYQETTSKEIQPMLPASEVIEKVISLGIRRVGATIHATSRDAMKKAHEANLVVNLWPGSCVEDFQLAYALGADIACSDVPVAVLDFVKNNMKWIKPMKDLK